MHLDSASLKDLPIGIFDSGIGGLTVLAALKKQLPYEKFLYLGDTARLPYGTKSDDTIRLYTQQVASLLCEHGIKLLVIACNTATSYGLKALQQSHRDLFVLGVIEPGAQKACELSQTNHIAVLATEATIRSQEYNHAIQALKPSAKVFSEACGLFVALVEEGFSQDAVAELVAQRYLQNLFEKDKTAQIDTVLLGCTHFPVLSAAIRAHLPKHIHIVNSAETTAFAVQEFLMQHQLFHSTPVPKTTKFWVTDSPERFARIGSKILLSPLAMEDISLIDIRPLA